MLRAGPSAVDISWTWLAIVNPSSRLLTVPSGNLVRKSIWTIPGSNSLFLRSNSLFLCVLRESYPPNRQTDSGGSDG